MSKRFYQRCTKCFERAFEFPENPNHFKMGNEKLIYLDGEVRRVSVCQHCGVDVPISVWGHDNLVARSPDGYPKYKGSTPIHWQWFRATGNWGYRDLVLESIKPFEGLKGTIMDIGWGDGLVASLLERKGFKVYGIEPEHDGIMAAKRMDMNTQDVQETIIEKYIEGKMIPVDYLYSLNTIEHVEDPTAFTKVMDSVKEFAIIITDNAINKLGQRRKTKELHNKEFSYPELSAIFSAFRTEPVDTGNGSFIGIKVYPHGK